MAQSQSKEINDALNRVIQAYSKPANGTTTTKPKPQTTGTGSRTNGTTKGSTSNGKGKGKSPQKLKSALLWTGPKGH
jgi:hypothetical protein